MLSVQAQLFSPESVGGAFWGSLIGGIAGGDCHHGFSGEGAAIGAGVGLIAGAIAGEARGYDYYDSPTCFGPIAPSVSFGYGYGNRGYSSYVHCSPNYYCAPGYYYRPTRPNYAVNGTLLGAASGALIGAGTHDAAEGAAIGAAAGLVLGSVAEATAQKREHGTSTVIQTPAALQPQVEQIPIAPTTQNSGLRARVSSDQITSRPCATSTYYWTPPPPQIPEAPRVPDAPGF